MPYMERKGSRQKRPALGEHEGSILGRKGVWHTIVAASLYKE